MFIGQYLAAMVPVALLWGWILAKTGDPMTGAWLLLAVPMLLWVVIDWLAFGSGILAGPNPGPRDKERFCCYLFMGVGTLPLVAAASGMMQLERFKPSFLPTLFSDGVDVVFFCLLGLIATSAIRLLGWSDSLFGRIQHGGMGGAGP